MVITETPSVGTEVVFSAPNLPCMSQHIDSSFSLPIPSPPFLVASPPLAASRKRKLIGGAAEEDAEKTNLTALKIRKL